MNRVLPQPLMSAAIFAGWLLFNNSIAPATILLAALLAVGIPLVTYRFWPEYPRTVRLRPLLRFLLVVIVDIVIANIRVARLILGPRDRLRPRFVVVPVDLRQPFPITLLASIITLTPGTVSARLSGDRRSLLVHHLDVEDPAHAARHIKDRYERPLREIFE